MDPGRRDERVAIYQDTGTTLGGVGQHVPAWSSVASRWARVEGQGSKNFWRAQQMQATATHLVTVTADSLTRTIEPFTFYFLWRSKRLNPIPGQQADYRDMEITFICEEEVSGD